jgi:RNA polymerase sigma-70 factor (ECF subfamily)
MLDAQGYPETLPRADSVFYPARRPSPFELDALYREHAAVIGRWASRMAGPNADVEDVVQDVFLVAHRRLHEWRGEGKITTWLYRITERVVRKQRRKERLRGWVRGLSDDFASNIPSEGPVPGESLEQAQASELVHAVLDGLSYKYRTVLTLHALDGWSGGEIATLMNTKLSTIWVWLHRGRARFSSRLEVVTKGAEHRAQAGPVHVERTPRRGRSRRQRIPPS